MRSPVRDGTREEKPFIRASQWEAVLKTLREVLCEAQSRGIELSASFLHFDRARDGLVGAENLKHALTDLRILPTTHVWTDSDLEECIYAITAHRSRVFFTRDDFCAYFSTETRVRNVGNWERNEDDKHKRGDANKSTKRLDRFKLIGDEEDELSPRSPPYSLSNNQPKNVESKSARRKKMKRPLGSLLPSWAHERSKRALKELEGLQRKRRAPWASAESSTTPRYDVPGIHLDSSRREYQDGDVIMDDPDGQALGDGAESSRSGSHGEVDAVTPSVLQFYCETSWKTYEIDADTTISYHILTHESMAPTYSLPMTPGVTPAPDPVFTSFRFTVFIDLFQRIDTLDACPNDPQHRVPSCSILQATDTLDGINKGWLVQPKLGIAAMPQYILGFGTGGHVALHLLANEIPLQAAKYHHLGLFANAQRGLVLFNSVVNGSHDGVRHGWNTWRRLLASGDSLEWHEGLVRSIFSEFYLSQVASSRQAAMKEFFKTRKQFFHASNIALTRALVQGAIKSRTTKVESLRNLLAQTLPFGVVIVHGSLDNVVPPSQVELLSDLFSSLSDSVADCLAVEADSPRVHIAWLKSGHEVLQERPRFVYDLLNQLVGVSVKADSVAPLETGTNGMGPGQMKTPSSVPEKQHTSVRRNSNMASSTPQDQETTETTAFDVSSTLPVRQSDESRRIAEHVQQMLDEEGLKWIQQELYDRELEGSGTTSAILKRYEEVLQQEARAERDRQLREEQKRRQHEAHALEKEAKRREELERELREKETHLSLQRKAHDSQKAFFEQMETQKALQAIRLMEEQLMALEDARSRKWNDLLLEEEAREVRNLEMTHKVSSIEREREEQERERYQVELQRQRLTHQEARRESLKKFQQEFEQNQFVCSAVEVYNLDLAVEYANFPALGDGARVLAHDLSQFYDIKSSQIAESNQRRAQAEELKKELADKDLTLRNLERVLLKAQNTGMIAKAGLGTVRIVPITAAEKQALVRDMDEKRDTVARLQHDQKLLIQELAWKDKLLQRLSVLIKRNEGFRTELLKKMCDCREKGNEMVLCVREDMEKLMEKRESNEKTMKRITIRLQSVRDEVTRAEQATTEYFDCLLRIEGMTQRLPRKTVLYEHGVESNELERRLGVLDAEQQRIRAELRVKRTTLDEYGTTTYTLEQGLVALEKAVPIEAADTSGSDKETFESKTQTSSEGRGGVLGEEVRGKKHTDRTPEEKAWVALDFLVNFAYYYKHIDADEVEIIQRHPDYQYKALKKQDIERLLALPARVSLALAFIKTNDELRAHALLRKYTFGDGDEHFGALADAFDLPESVGPAASVTASLPDALAALEQIENPVLRSRSVLLQEDTVQPLSLLSVQSQQIPPHKSVTHTFRLPTERIGVLALTVSIVFHGHFKSVGYQNGRLAAMLYALPPPSSALSISKPLPIGKCSSVSDVSLCTPHSMGKLVIRHDPAKKPVSTDATYQLVLGAPVLTSYSVEITAKTAAFASEVLRKKRSDALKKQEMLPLKKDEIKNVFVTIQLSERKKRLARKLANEAQDAARIAELEMLRDTKTLETDNALSQMSADERRILHSKIHASEIQFTQQCFMFAKREEEARDIESALQELTKIHVDLLEEVAKMERDLVEYREYLPQIAAALVETNKVAARDAAGARLAKELNTEYVTTGARSGQVLWAELSAMKAKLPSMMTPAERLRRKYKKGLDVLEKKEREWILVDRILHPEMYEWEERLVVDGNYRLRLHGTHPKLAKDEEALATLSQMEVERILKAPWNLLERKEIQIRKIFTRFRDDIGGGRAKPKASQSPITMVSMLRTQKLTDLTTEEREWRLYDQLLNPIYYPVLLKNLAEELEAHRALQSAKQIDAKIPQNLTREDLVVALNTPEEELFKLPSELLRARNVLLKYDPQLSTNLVEAARLAHGQSIAYEKAEMDIDARCRLVFTELQRAIANTRNEYMDSSALHSTMQRFPTKVLRLELEKELDRLLISQIVEKEQFEMENFLKSGNCGRQSISIGGNDANQRAEDSVSSSDSDEEAQIARERKAQQEIKQAAKNGQRDKVRGRALKQKTIQKQRREIKDALQGRSLEEQRRLAEAHALGPTGCMACRASKCQWKPFLQESYVTIEKRIEILQEELEAVKRSPDPVITSTVCLAAVKSGNRAVTLRKSDLFDELTLELKIWDKNLRLRAVDAEFHDTFGSKEQYFETKALHGFPQVQLTEKVQVALQREHNSLVANLTACEVVEDILEFMLEGWVFGERESERRVMGYVPSLKREGPLTMQDLRRLEQERRVVDAKASLKEEEDIQGIPLDKWKPIEVSAFELNTKNKAVKKGSALDKQLTETENALKFGIFCMTLMYFRGLSLLKKQKTVWSTSALKNQKSRSSSNIAERKRMDLQARNVAARDKKAALYDEKARIGMARKQKLQEQQVAAYRRRMVLENQKAKREARAALYIQRMYRGHMGRRAGKKWMIRRREIDAQRALDNAAAVMLQRAYRGRLGRLKAEERRIELAEFISQVRADEAIEEEEEYWRHHRVERVVRRVGAFLKKQA
ncbi:hypothetical protein Poli38472_011382 [Pythium oligandrum]|uniref:EF-hand domain-containing protein n=1 Tax=Pythium oligandrum TaxID=41045 RepID=A0A8K1FM51_PYTOL|nr:hypothetical protein Poli38472_011382 [Pythium oligandrum]|eukprot:TMW64502.1 hypothetical protein Poli38472_011382 [Pythium oligandrum]